MMRTADSLGLDTSNLKPVQQVRARLWWWWVGRVESATGGMVAAATCTL
jgi:hypothetical protein